MKNPIITLMFLFSIITLPIDSFPFGAEHLKELGARPTNIFLFILLVLFLLHSPTKTINNLIPKKKFYLIIIPIALATSILSTDFNFSINKNFERDPFYAFTAQSLMFLWLFISYKIWLLLIKFFHIKTIIKSIKISSIALITSALIDFYIVKSENYQLGQHIFNWIQFYNDPYRVSGITSEPSILGAYCSFAWPLLFLGTKNNKIYVNKKNYFGYILIFLGLYFGARTFQAIFAIQIALYLIITLKNKNSILKTISITALFLAIPFTSIYLYETTLSLEANLSSLARLGSTITAINTYLNNPLFGIGPGQFDYHYSYYVSNLFYLSDEVIAWASGQSSTRVSTFNLPIRLLVEFGIFGIFIIIPFVKETLKIIKNNFLGFYNNWFTLVLLSFTGGLLFIFSQDQYGYQPFIFSFALLTYYSNTHSNERHSHPIN